MRKLHAVFFLLTLTLLVGQTAPAAGPAAKPDARMDEGSGTTITTARFNQIRDQYRTAKAEYDTARSASTDQHAAPDLQKKAEAYQTAYRDYIEASQKRRVD